jgi:toxin-antitoxin system, toxin component, Txe/YoeB family
MPKKLASSNFTRQSARVTRHHSNQSVSESAPYEKLVGDLEGAYSRRINIQHRLVYEVIESENTVKILRMWTHYE